MNKRTIELLRMHSTLGGCTMNTSSEVCPRDSGFFSSCLLSKQTPSASQNHWDNGCRTSHASVSDSNTIVWREPARWIVHRIYSRTGISRRYKRRRPVTNCWPEHRTRSQTHLVVNSSLVISQLWSWGKRPHPPKALVSFLMKIIIKPASRVVAHVKSTK